MRSLVIALVLLTCACGNPDTEIDKYAQMLQDNDFHVTICHYPPGNIGNPQTITVGHPAVLAAHFKNHDGDHFGECTCEELNNCEPVCGDQECSESESCESCEQDCGVCPPPPPYCGDQSCNGSESCSSCEIDCGICPPVCGDNTCDENESCENCESDCGECPPPPPSCGDQECNGDETCETCPLDCGECPPTCGDEICDEDESCETCPSDCGECPPVCGDEECNGEESCSSCPLDCGECEPYCGDEVCDEDESCETCSTDCGECPPPEPYCGDATCGAGEGCDNCPEDCGVCPAPPGFCGDSECRIDESCTDCEVDCGKCPIQAGPVCGNSLCEIGESCEKCEKDCGACPQAPVALVGGSGCNAAGSGSTSKGLLFILAILAVGALLIWTKQKFWVFLIAFGLLATDARAATPVPYDHFTPAMTFQDYWQTYTSEARKDHTISLRAMYDFADKPLMLINPNTGDETTVLDGRHTLRLMGVVSLWSWLEVGMSVPVIIETDEGDTRILNNGVQQQIGGGVGDLNVMAKGQLLKVDWFTLGYMLPATIPTGNEFRLQGNGAFTLKPGVTVGMDLDFMRIGANTGMVFTDARTVPVSPIQTIDRNMSWFGSLAANVPIPVWDKRVSVVSDLFGSVSVEKLDRGQSDLEWINGLRGRVWKGLYADAGFGAGFASGVAVPRYRALMSIGWDFGWEEPAKRPQRVEAVVPPPCAEPVVEVEKLILPVVYFGTDQHHVLDSSRDTLDKAAEILKNHPEITHVRVEAHADRRASGAYNIRLTVRRARQVVSELVKRGVSRDRLQPFGYGEEHADQKATIVDLKAEKHHDRRADLTIVEVK